MGTPRGGTAEGSGRAPAQGHVSPGLLIVLGVIVLLFAVLAITLQTQTSESFISGTQQKTQALTAQWTIWLQIPKIAFGDGVAGPSISSDDWPGIFIGQGVEITYICLTIGLNVTMRTTSKLGRFIRIVVLIALGGIAIYDFYTDLIYGNLSTTGHLFFAGFTTFVIGFFPTWGFALIRAGWKHT